MSLDSSTFLRLITVLSLYLNLSFLYLPYRIDWHVVDVLEVTEIWSKNSRDFTPNFTRKETSIFHSLKALDIFTTDILVIFINTSWMTHNS